MEACRRANAASAQLKQLLSQWILCDPRRADRFVDLEQLRHDPAPFYSSIGRPSIDSEAVRDVNLFVLPSQEPFPIFVRRYAELTTKGASQPLLISKPGLPRYPL